MKLKLKEQQLNLQGFTDDEFTKHSDSDKIIILARQPMGVLVNNVPLDLIKWAVEYLEKNQTKSFSPNPYYKLDKLKLAIKNKSNKSTPLKEQQYTGEDYIKDLKTMNNLLKQLIKSYGREI